jgi:hypothetical protein
LGWRPEDTANGKEYSKVKEQLNHKHTWSNPTPKKPRTLKHNTNQTGQHRFKERAVTEVTYV